MFEEMNGYEFESFIATLLRNKGFEVQETQYSNDGGIDLIAKCFAPFYKGTYIIQCKKYSETLVGQPEVRDLFGVVMSERANKGILITTSDFSDQAHEFAAGKNIELINGKELKKILESNAEEPSIASKVTIIKNTPAEEDFTLDTRFNKDRYRFLQAKIENEPKEPNWYSEMYDLLRPWVWDSSAVEMCKAGLIDKIFYYLNQELNTCYRRKNEKISYYKLRADDRLIDMLMVVGELAKATEMLHEKHSLLFDEYEDFAPFIYRNMEYSPKRSRLKLNLYMHLQEVGAYNTTGIMEKDLKAIENAQDYVIKRGMELITGTTISIWKDVASTLNLNVDNILNLKKMFYDAVVRNKTLRNVVYELNVVVGYDFYAHKFINTMTLKDLEVTTVEKILENVQHKSVSFFRENYYKKDDATIQREMEEVMKKLGLE